MNKPYIEFAKVYDLMQYDVDYDAWNDALLKIISKNAPNARKILELAAGTGNMSIRLSRRGFVVEAIDISGEMLAIASTKSIEEKQRIRYYEQDMREFDTHKKYDIILSVCDGMNYLVEQADFDATLDRIHEHLNPNGLVIFDLSSEYKLSEIIGNTTFAETFEQSAYIWENEYEPDSKRLNFLLTLFIESQNGYNRFEEYHQQRAYDIDEVKKMVEDKFTLVDIVDGDTFKTVHEKSNRICYILKGK